MCSRFACSSREPSDCDAALRAGTGGFAPRDAPTVSTTPPIAIRPPIAVSTVGTWPSHIHAINDATSGCTYMKLDTFAAGARDSAKFQQKIPEDRRRDAQISRGPELRMRHRRDLGRKIESERNQAERAGENAGDREATVVVRASKGFCQTK